MPVIVKKGREPTLIWKTPRGVMYAVRWLSPPASMLWWCLICTPPWHEGRGRYISIGLLRRIALYRGY